MKILGTALLASALWSTSALASVTITATTSPDSSPLASETMIFDFEGISPASYLTNGMAHLGYTISGGELHITPLVPGIAAPPVGDTTQYLAVLTGGSAVMLTPQPIYTLSAYLGSLDDYNTITFHDVLGHDTSLTGTQLVQLAPPPDLTRVANGDQQSAITNRRFFFSFTDAVTSVTFTSSGNSFEFDNIAAGVTRTLNNGGTGPVPEPSTWALLLAGFGAVGFNLRRRQVANTATA